jgi:hypothetical protein
MSLFLLWWASIFWFIQSSSFSFLICNSVLLSLSFVGFFFLFVFLHFFIT